MYVYDDNAILQRLERLGKARRAAFAGACAERLIPLYEVFADKTGQGNRRELRNALDFLWDHISREPNATECHTLSKYADTCESLSPEEDSQWTDLSAYAQDAAASAAYALRCLVTGKPEMALSASRRAYEAMDYFVHNKNQIDFAAPGAEETILKAPEVQRELAAQFKDLDALIERPLSDEQAVVQELRRRASSGMNPIVSSLLST